MLKTERTKDKRDRHAVAVLTRTIITFVETVQLGCNALKTITDNLQLFVRIMVSEFKNLAEKIELAIIYRQSHATYLEEI